MKLLVLAERVPGERRVALVPDHVATWRKAGADVYIESGAGSGALIADAAYTDAGAVVVDGAELTDCLRTADALLGVQPPAIEDIALLRAGAITVSFLPTGANLPTVVAARDAGVSTFALELVPRISRAQSMDALSSQALVTGYYGALVGATLLPRFFPLAMTAAGTVRPAKVLVLGAGVAGLQAIATCRRLGSLVSAYDVRAAAAEEVASLGAKFIDLDLPTLEGAGGYAREMTEERAALQRERLSTHVAAADVLITTAAVPGRRAPLLVEAATVERMKPGSVVVDLAADSGGNVEGSRPGETVRIGDARVWGGSNVPSAMADAASRLLSANVTNLLTLMVRDGALAPDFDDEIIAGACVTSGGEVRHAPTRAALEAADQQGGAR